MFLCEICVVFSVHRLNFPSFCRESHTDQTGIFVGMVKLGGIGRILLFVGKVTLVELVEFLRLLTGFLENGRAFSSQVKVMEFCSDWKSQGILSKTLENSGESRGILSFRKSGNPV